jgi:hypothetical protein
MDTHDNFVMIINISILAGVCRTANGWKTKAYQLKAGENLLVI